MDHEIQASALKGLRGGRDCHLLLHPASLPLAPIANRSKDSVVPSDHPAASRTLASMGAMAVQRGQALCLTRPRVTALLGFGEAGLVETGLDRQGELLVREMGGRSARAPQPRSGSWSLRTAEGRLGTGVARVEEGQAGLHSSLSLMAEAALSKRDCRVTKTDTRCVCGSRKEGSGPNGKRREMRGLCHEGGPVASQARSHLRKVLMPSGDQRRGGYRLGRLESESTVAPWKKHS